MITRKQFLMNEQDGSPGGGTPAAPPVESSAPTTTAQTPAIPVDAIKAAVAEAFGEMRNGLFADLRKSGALKTAEKTQTVEPKTVAAPEPKTQANDQSVDVETMARREYAIGRAENQYELTPKQVEYMRSALKAANPEDERAWIRSFASDMGFEKNKPTAQVTPAPSPSPEPAKPAAAPAAPSSHTLPSVNGVVDLFNLTPPQLQAIGPKGVRNALEQLWSIGNQMAGAPARPKPNQR